MIDGKIFVTRELAPAVIQRLRTEFREVDVWAPYEPPTPAELADHAVGCVALLTMVSDRIDEELLNAAPTLKVVANMAVGYNNVDIIAATARGILITNTPNVLEETTADMAFGLMLAVARRVVESDSDTRAGNWGLWHPGLWLGHDVHGATLGIVGLGSIGSAVARRAKGFDMQIKYTARNRRHDSEVKVGAEFVPSLYDMLSQSDFVSLHVPLTDSTRDLISTSAFDAMKSTAYLVNTSRGDVVNTDALLAALQNGTIAGAGIDVTSPEPLTPDHPLLQQPNLVITPHIGSATHATRNRMAMLAAENAIAVCSGASALNLVGRDL